MSKIDEEATAQPVVPDAATAAASTGPIEGNLNVYLQSYVQRIRGGDLGSLPAVGGLIVLVAFFWIIHPSFGSLLNVSNLITDAAPTILLAMGLVFVLLLGEIDLAAGTTAGVSAATMVRVSGGYNAPWPVAILVAIVTGVIIGLLTGVLRAKVRIPSFVVTLAIFLALQGVILIVLINGKGIRGTDVPVSDKFINDFENGQLTPLAGWILAAVVILGYALSKMYDTTRRRQARLIVEPTILSGLKFAAVAIGSLLFVFLLNQNRAINKGTTLVVHNGHQVLEKAPTLQGVPIVVVPLVALFAIWTFVLGRTRYGRHVYAVGGNAEAARRAGIQVDRIRISVFVICSTMGAVAGIMLASNIQTVSSTLGTGNTLLLAVGAAVIGGTSLFGGRGRIIDAVLGGLVVAVIGNGMSDLIHGKNNAAIQNIVTGLVLLLAAAVDALSRRRAGASGL
ncbi:MAG: sugar ABC transporter permease [Jatrophihabitans sp.]